MIALLVSDLDGVRVAAVASSDMGARWGNLTTISRADPCNAFAAPSIGVSVSGVLAISWYEDAGTHVSEQDCSAWGEGVSTYVSLSRDGGASFAPGVSAGGPPGWRTVTFGDAVAFDDNSRVHVTWHAIAPNWNDAKVYVAVSDRDVTAFVRSNFTTAMTAAGGNSTQQENLAAGLDDSVYLLWEAFSSSGAPEDGIFIRRVIGEIAWEVQVLPGVTDDVPIMTEIRSEEGAPVASSSSRQFSAPVPPAEYSLNLTRGDLITALGVVRVRAWGATAITIVVSPPELRGSDMGVVPLWSISIPVAALAMVVVYVYWRRSRAKGLQPR